MTVSGCIIQFTGSITDASCIVNASADVQTVALGQYRTADFTSSPQNFNIKLKNCAVYVGTKTM